MTQKKKLSNLVSIRIHSIVLLLFLASPLAIPQNGFSQNVISLPPYHWAQDYLWQYQIRHPSPDFFVGALPITMGEAISYLAGAGALQGNYLGFLNRRLNDYANVYGKPAKAKFPFMHIGWLLQENLGQLQDDLQSRLSWRIISGAALSPNLRIVNTINLDQNLQDDPEYLGKKWRRITGFTEQGYIVWKAERFTVKFGRDFVRWGRGYDATLAISDASRPFDQLFFQYRTRNAQFSYFTSRLDPVSLSDSVARQMQSPVAQRYLSAGRLDLAFLNHRLQVGVMQAVVYGGVRGFEWSFLNPFMVQYGEVVNDNMEANIMGSIDFAFYPGKAIELYGQLLIDDVQVEKTGPADLEPNEIGVMLGMQVADPFRTPGLTLGVEYTRVTNRTYNTLSEAERYVHRNKPIGHFWGNDFDRWLLHGRKYLGRDWLLKFSAEFRRHGEGRVNVPFDQPWLNFTVEEGYSEPFPTGIVEKMQVYFLELRWHPKSVFFVSLAGRLSNANNYGNISGQELNRAEVFVKLWWEVQKFWPL